MRPHIVRIWLSALVLPVCRAFGAPDDITPALDRNYYNPHALSLKYVLSVPPAASDKRYELSLFSLDRKNHKRTNWANIELPCRREHDIYFLWKKTVCAFAAKKAIQRSEPSPMPKSASICQGENVRNIRWASAAVTSASPKRTAGKWMRLWICWKFFAGPGGFPCMAKTS